MVEVKKDTLIKIKDSTVFIEDRIKFFAYKMFVSLIV
jgi:hypothetical protein